MVGCSVFLVVSIPLGFFIKETYVPKGGKVIENEGDQIKQKFIIEKNEKN